MSHQFYVERNNKRCGPFSATQLKTLGAASRIHSTDIVWQDGREKGVLAAHVTGLLPVVHADACPDAGVPVDEADSSPSVENVFPQIVVSQPPHNTEHVQEPPSEPTEIPDGLRLKKIPGEIDIDDLPPVATDASRENIKGGTHALSSEPAARELTPQDKPVDGPDQPTPHKDRVRKLRAVAVKGAVILSQNGTFVTYKKKCFKCSLEDVVAARMRLRSGLNRASFFCPKCRKTREVEIQGNS